MPNPKQKMVAVKVDLPKDLDRAIEAAAFRADKPKRQIVEIALCRYLGRKDPE